MQRRRCRYIAVEVMHSPVYTTAISTAAAAAPGDELDVELKRKWFDAPNLDFAHIYAGITKHLRVHMSPIGTVSRYTRTGC